MKLAALKKILLILPVITLLYFLSISASHAQTIPTPSHPQNNVQEYLVPNTNSDVPKNLHVWTQSILLEFLSALTCQIGGINPINPEGKCLGLDIQTGKLGYIENGHGAIGTVGNMIAALYTPPLQTGDYATYLASNFGIAKSSYAQNGIGFKGLAGDGQSPVLAIWLKMRDLVYLLFVIVFVLIGFMIMLRIKIDPRTVMTIQNQIPKIIIGIILLTFSFAIAGFAIDMMYVVTYAIVNILISATSPDIASQNVIFQQMNQPAPGFANELFSVPQAGNSNFVGGIFNVAWLSSLKLQAIISSIFAPKEATEALLPVSQISQCSGFLDVGCWLGEKIGGTVGSSLSLISGWLISWIVGILAILIILIALLFALIRLWFELLKAYIFFILDVIVAPFWIIGGVVPGSGFNFSGWLRDIIANLSAFPVAITLLVLARIFFVYFQANLGGGAHPEQFIPPLIGNPGAFDAIGSLLALGFILLAPKSVQIMRDTLKTPEFKYISAIGEAVGTGRTVTTGVTGSIGGKLFERSSSGDAIGPLAVLAQRYNRRGAGTLRTLLGIRRPSTPAAPAPTPTTTP